MDVPGCYIIFRYWVGSVWKHSESRWTACFREPNGRAAPDLNACCPEVIRSLNPGACFPHNLDVHRPKFKTEGILKPVSLR